MSPRITAQNEYDYPRYAKDVFNAHAASKEEITLKEIATK
jgi:hypothetical protein